MPELEETMSDPKIAYSTFQYLEQILRNQQAMMRELRRVLPHSSADPDPSQVRPHASHAFDGPLEQTRKILGGD
jgi:hypothetical protein